MTLVEQLVLGEAALDVAVAVAPRPELLDDPRGEAGGRVLERVAERLRLGALDLLVAGALLRWRSSVAERRAALGERGRSSSGSGGAITKLRWMPQTCAGSRRPSSGRHDRAPVAALRAVTLVAEPAMISRTPRPMRRCPAGLGGRPREAVARQRRQTTWNASAGSPPWRGGSASGPMILSELDDRPGPAVGHHQRQRVGLGRPGVDEVDDAARRPR